MNFLWNLFVPLGISFLFFQSINGRHRHSRHLEKSSIEIEYDTRRNELLSTFECRVPKPRLVYVHEELPHMIEINTSIWDPPSAIVHRCEDASGCCSLAPLSHCSPTGTQEVNIVFKKMNIAAQNTTFETLRFVNHTSCACNHVGSWRNMRVQVQDNL